MKRLAVILGILYGSWALAAPVVSTTPPVLSKSFSPPTYCDALKLQFDQKIKDQIEKGIPFDLVVLMKSSSGPSCQTVINIRYDLWNEVVRFSKEGRNSGSETLASARESLCQWTQCLERPAGAPQSLVQVRVLMNPLWEGQSKALIRTKHNAAVQFFRIEWNELAQDLPKDLEILNQEVQL